MAESSSYTSLPTSHLPGSVPAVITEEKAPAIHKDPEANLQIFPPNSGGGGQGYQTLTNRSDGDGSQSANNWNGAFSISSYTQYFNVDTDDVMNRLTSSLYPSGDFFRKIEANPDLSLQGWKSWFANNTPICKTLMKENDQAIWAHLDLHHAGICDSALGNCATYLMSKKGDTSASWTFDVSYFHVSAIAVYGYVFLVPLGFYLCFSILVQRLALSTFGACGDTLSSFSFSALDVVTNHVVSFLFVNTCMQVLLVIPVDFLRWTITLITGVASAAFVGLNLRSHVELNDLTIVLVAACVAVCSGHLY
ncbi:hypothetical protein OSB04_017469 [Centaurea solstitialis]|uniref:Uncharacterized protein n=1 Tax=Centaurea solstitialis TaxID=347529 RepID=A0AA38T2Y8_9ASTR|nr:hypothetical protein OSB04_017469 [Centaurea solstitialis]